MATNIFLGYPPEKIKQFIIENYGPKDMSKVPLTFTAEEPNAKLRLRSSNGPTVTLETSSTGEDGTWSPYTVGNEITLANVGDKVMFRNSSDGIQAMGNYDGGHTFEISQGKIAASGSIMFLMDKTGELRDLSGYDRCFSGLFVNCTSLTQAPVLPATTLAMYCYNEMFAGCTSLTKAPVLPAETLGDFCYNYMFYGCTSLTNAYFPNLDSMTVTYHVVMGPMAFDGAASNIEIQCSDKILVINSTSV